MTSRINKTGNAEFIKEEKTPGFYIKARHVLAVMIFFTMFNTYAHRVNLSVAIVGMVNITMGVQNGSSECFNVSTNMKPVATNGPFNWSAAQQGLLHSSFFYGYILSNILGAWLSKKLGFKLVMGMAMLINSLITICTPISAYASFELVVVLRAVIGFAQGAITPSIVGLWDSWGPSFERSFLTSFGISGSSAGTFICLSLGGVITDMIGWEAVFYTTGGTGLICVFFWFLLVCNTPEQHPRISEQEKKYITRSREHLQETNLDGVPWRQMLTSPPVWAIICSHFSANWSLYMLLTMLPTYMATILNFDIAASGWLSSLPYVVHWIFTFMGGYLVDLTRRKGLTSTVAARKIATTLSLAGSSLFLVLTGYIGCNAVASVAFLSLATGCISLEIPGTVANTLDIAPKFAGIIYGISNTIGSVPGVLAPQITGWLLDSNNSLSQWQIIFWITTGISLAANVAFVLLASGNVQLWAKTPIQKPKQELVQCVTQSASTVM